MGFENTNFIDDLGHDMKKDHPILGCLGIILVISLIGFIPYVIVYTAGNYTKAGQMFLQKPVFVDAGREITFDLPAGWYNFSEEKDAEKYSLVKVFKNQQKSSAALEKVSYKKLKYTPKKMKKDPAGIARQIRAALKQKALASAGLVNVGEGTAATVMDEYTGYKMAEILYLNSYGCARYKKGNNIVVYYFKPLKKYMLVMTYKYEDSEKYGKQAEKEEEKLAAMWEKAFVVKNN